MKRGNLASQPFFYMLALVAMALILFFGVKSVRDVLMVSDDVLLGDAVIQLRNDLSVMSNFDVGSYKEFSYAVPKKITRMCFLQPDAEITVRAVDAFLLALMEQSLRENLFVEPLDAFAQSSYVLPSLYVSPEENPLCFFLNKQGTLTLGLETVLEGGELVVAVRRSA